MTQTIYLKSLGCARNQVDSEQMLGWLQTAGWNIVEDPDQANVIVVNTCSFIEDAADESIDAILTLATYKTEGVCERLVVTGCLPERYREEIIRALPEVDIFLGTGAFNQINEAALGRLPTGGCLLPDPQQISLDTDKRVGRNHYSNYIKIAEGCNRHCTYCIIPKLRGRQKSRPMHDIIDEARQLLSNGVKELTLISQDTTAYGVDLTGNHDLGELLSRLAELPEAHNAWIRFLYGHPESIQPDLLQTVAKYTNVPSYFDIPIQHASDKILTLMGRNYTSEDLANLINTIRDHVPNATLRTTVIVGFPGETNSDLKKLIKFIEKYRFDHLGVFTYSDSYDLPSHFLSNPVGKKLAQQRKHRLMRHQQKISAWNNEKYLGRRLQVLVESQHDENIYLARTIFQAPEVDGLVYLHAPEGNHTCRVGELCQTRITDTLEYDLIGEVV